MKQRAGFTLLELLITMGVLGVIVSFTVPSYKAMQDRIALNSAAEQLADALQVAQNRAVTEGISNHGVRFYSDRFETFVDGMVGSTQSHPLPTNVVLSYNASQVTFTRLTGQSDAAANLIVTDGSLQRTLAVNLNGKIDLN